MPLNANVLVSLDEAKSWLSITGASEDAKLTDEINRAAEACEYFCNRPLKAATYTTVRVMGGQTAKLYPKAAPIDITAAVTVTIDGTAQTVWKSESDGDPALKDVIVGSDDHTTLLGQRNHLWRGAGWGCASWSNPYNVLLTYTGGLSTIPDDLKGACLYVIQKLWRDRQKGLIDVSSISSPAGSLVTTEVTSIMFATIPMPRWARMSLERYRVASVG